jgi:bifunctional non-homologous end joining protein LigD
MAAATGEKLAEYRSKRDFRKTLEPAGADKAADQGCLYVMHHHAASRDHYDLRLQHGNVLRSWALPKGASLTPGEKRLAIEVEDHPLEYGYFEGIIPEGEYGGGTVMLWDAGTWSVAGTHDANHIDLELHGKKLEGRWTLVRTKWREQGKKADRSWLMIKRSDTPPRTLQPDDRSVATGRTMDEITADKNRVWRTNERARKLTGARKREMPAMIAPQLTTLVDEAPDGDGWLHEIKFDGYRIMARLDHGQVLLYTRKGLDWTDRFPQLAQILSTLSIGTAILDGEVTARKADGTTSFRKLQEWLSAGDTRKVHYHCFDLPYLEGYDLTGSPLIERKRALLEILQAEGIGHGHPVVYSEHIEGNGRAFHEQACKLGLEGIVSKRIEAPYSSRRDKTWLKIKCTRQQSFVVGGFTPASGSRIGFRSLLLGAFDGPELRYAGRVGTGFGAQQLHDLHRRLTALTVNQKPFVDEVPGPLTGVTWVEPRVVVEVEYTEQTRDGRLRHPAFRSVRDDLEPADITMEKPTAKQAGRVSVAGVRITHPDRILYSEQGVTKLDLAHYYESVAEYMIPLLARRPLSLVRCPDGAESQCFYQKHPSASFAKGMPRIAIEEKDDTRDYVYVESVSHLITLVQAGTLEIHAWGSHIDDLEHPDLMVFDLDPGPDVGWNFIIETTRDLRERLQNLGLTGFLRISGGKGLHVVIPLKPRADWDAVKAFALALAERQASDDPKRLTTNMSKAKRHGRIFIDYLRNGRGATAIANYSTRARPGAPVAVPLRWDELDADLRPDAYNIHNLRRRLRALKSDPWEGFDEARVPLPTKGP